MSGNRSLMTSEIAQNASQRRDDSAPAEASLQQVTSLDFKICSRPIYSAADILQELFFYLLEAWSSHPEPREPNTTLSCSGSGMFVFSWVGTALASCAATCACHACTITSKEVMRRSARLAYCFLFTLAMILAWVLRDFAKPLLEKLPCESLYFLSYRYYKSLPISIASVLRVSDCEALNIYDAKAVVSLAHYQTYIEFLQHVCHAFILHRACVPWSTLQWQLLWATSCVQSQYGELCEPFPTQQHHWQIAVQWGE